MHYRQDSNLQNLFHFGPCSGLCTTIPTTIMLVYLSCCPSTISEDGNLLQVAYLDRFLGFYKGCAVLQPIGARFLYLLITSSRMESWPVNRPPIGDFSKLFLSTILKRYLLQINPVTTNREGLHKFYRDYYFVPRM